MPTHAHLTAIVVRGRLSSSLVAALDGYRIEALPGGMTRVVGPVADQSMLFGLLGMFDGLNIEVVSVNQVDP
ncbi:MULTISPECIES: hypothetical protein [unclassified Microbacterium]|uniref:hypothetical protein n=1 Tax=unclassified Microbacterium TaxID=2609290 RepID=UPI00214BED16|nr:MULTISPECIES: hypothetical protein [unclassified Microbacterium]MCR2785312.1 hypothetical protein [Microbacterium sp. zg.B96]WIM16840.1 hypothetical protein QNO11_04130 [Microbacterium sp. zg-B96]